MELVKDISVMANCRVTTYIKNILERQDATVYSALEFERDNEVEPNFFRYANKFNATADDIIFSKPKRKIKIMFQNDYDRYWKVKIMESPKAISYCKFKHNASLDKYMYTIKNVRHKIALTRLRLSNHNLRIETGRHLTKIAKTRQERKCFICIDEIENELHFVVKCPLYSSERKELYKALMHNSKHFDSLTSDEQKLMFIMTNEDNDVMAKLAKFVFNSMQIRERIIKIENVYKYFQACVLIDSL